MIEFCPWSKVFSRYDSVINEIFAILYWYLFNKPDFASNIASTLNGLKNLDFPKSVYHDRRIGIYLHEMEEYNLIARKEIKKGAIYFQALSFFYLDPFCIKTPHSAGPRKNCRKRTIEGKDITAHYKEYQCYVTQLRAKKKEIYKYSEPFRSFPLSFDLRENNSVIPAQKIVQYYSSDSEKFMKKIFQRKWDHMTLYNLIKESLEEVSHFFLLYDYERMKEDYFLEEPISFPREFYEFKGFTILSKEKITEAIEQTIPELIQLYDIVEWFGQNKPPRVIWDLLRSHLDLVTKCVENQLDLYRKVQRGEKSFNEETLLFNTAKA